MSAADGELSIDGATPLRLTTAAAVEAACERAELDRSDFVVIEVTGAPAGAWADAADAALRARWELAVRRLERLAATTVAVARGDIGGAALDVLLATDFRIAMPDTRLLLRSEGSPIWPGMALYRLVQQAGIGAVRRTVLFGHRLDAIAAVALGLLHEVTPDPAAAVGRVVQRIGCGCAGVAARHRELLADAAVSSFEEALSGHLAACADALRGLR